MEPLSATASIISILQLSAKVLSYLNDVKDASKGRVQCAIEASNLHSLLLNLRFRLEEGNAGEPWYTAVRALAVDNGPLDQFKKALEMLQTKMTDGGRLKQASQALVWKFKKEDIASILAQMERLKTLIEIALQMDNFKLSQAIKADTSIFRIHVPIMQSNIQTLRHGQDFMKHRRLLDWISPSDYPAQQSDIIKRRGEGTGQWFLGSLKVAHWLNKSKATLFCPGIPGAGKTMIAAIAIDHLLELAEMNSCGVAYVYCNYKAPQEEQDAPGMLAAILKQLVQGRVSAIEPVEKLHKRHASRGTKPSLEEIYSTLRDVLDHYQFVHVVIDALDECQIGARRQFLARLVDLQAEQDIRLMVTSRFGIEDIFKDATRLEIQAHKEDVKCFVASQIYRLPRCIQRDHALQKMVQEKIAEAVDGMFLLARLHTDSLQDKRTVKDVKVTLANLSKGVAALHDAYAEAIQRIQGQLDGDRKLAMKVIFWITFAKRPLATNEICCALAVELGDTELNQEHVPDVEDLVSVCAGLVVVDQHSAVIRLVHYTAQEYFEQIGNTWNPDGQLHVATTCLTYLCFDAFRSGYCATSKEFDERLQQNHFLDYAARHWGQHAKAVETRVSDLACRLLRSRLFSSALQVSESLRQTKYSTKTCEFDHRITAVHYTAQFGLAGITELILSAVEELAVEAVNAEDSAGRTPLWIAARYGHGDMVKMFLHKGADVNKRGKYSDALEAASSKGHEQVVKLLLDNGAHLGVHGRYSNALQAASTEGHEQVVRLLLIQGANSNAQGGQYGSALQAASFRGHEEVVKLLLNKGADVNAHSGYYGNALYLASSEGHEQVVKLLLSMDANIISQGRYYGNALYAASFRGHEQVVMLLLNKSANIEAVGRHYGNALYAASYRGHEQLLKVLLQYRPIVNAQSGTRKYRTRRVFIQKLRADG
ncbi:ankyrin repeat domain-containing protein [Pyrenochaeta sp. MPI-SDFR-AT-0127]|nr:ankyrin repeat domain-containing protein [Pyrenochaeta sp. MPI-SDFR-AT-0127]